MRCGHLTSLGLSPDQPVSPHALLSLLHTTGVSSHIQVIPGTSSSNQNWPPTPALACCPPCSLSRPQGPGLPPQTSTCPSLCPGSLPWPCHPHPGTPPSPSLHRLPLAHGTSQHATPPSTYLSCPSSPEGRVHPTGGERLGRGHLLYARRCRGPWGQTRLRMRQGGPVDEELQGWMEGRPAGRGRVGR